jgi:hypothetical protein
MAKKNKRQKQNRTPNFGAIPAAQTEFNPDYSIIKRDLKRIGMLAGFFIALLVALSFYLN